MGSRISRRRFLTVAGGVATAIPLGSVGDATGEQLGSQEHAATPSNHTDRIVDMHIHFDEKNSNFIRDLVTLAQRLNLTALPAHSLSSSRTGRRSSKTIPKTNCPFGFVDLDASNVLSEVKDFHTLGYRGLGELDFVKTLC
jgi:hypothetical protein